MTDAEWFERIKAGDEDAFVRLYRERQGSIYRFALHMSGSPNVAEDVVQEVFMTLVTDGCQFDARRGSLAGYLFGIARNVVADHARRTRWESPLTRDGDSPGGREWPGANPDLLGDLAEREALDSLQQAIGSLPQHYREVVVLCELQEMDYVLAAKVLGCPVGTIRSRLSRARALLAKKMARREVKAPAEEWKKAPMVAL